MTDQTKVLPPLSDDECIVHIYPSDLERMATNECTATAFSVAVGCPDERSVPLYTADQMREYAIAVLAQHAQQAVESEQDKALGQRVDDLAALVRRLVRALNKAAPDNDLPAKAMDYLKRHGLQGSPLRSQQPAQADKDKP